MKRFLCCCAAIVVIAPAPPAAGGEGLVSTAAFLLRQSLRPQPDGRHELIFRTLRHIGDPELAPLFERAATSRHNTVRLHGILGLAEIRAEKHIDLGRLAAFEDADFAGRVVHAAAKRGFLSIDQARRVLRWKELGLGVRLVAASHLVAADALPSRKLIRHAGSKGPPRVRALATLLLRETAAGKIEQAGASLARLPAANRGRTALMLLRTALEHGFAGSAPWARGLAADADLPFKVRVLAHRAAIRFDGDAAVTAWHDAFAASDDPARRRRLALAGLRSWRWLSPVDFRPLARADSELIAAMGRAGRAACGGGDAARAVGDLIEHHHPVATGWALDFAAHAPDPVMRRRIWLRTIRAFPRGPRDRLARRLEHVVEATASLAEDRASAAIALLPRWTTGSSPPALVRGILLGLMRAKGRDLHRAAGPPEAMPDRVARRLTLLLHAKHAARLAPSRARRIADLVRGGHGLPVTLRLEAAWGCLERRGKVGETVRRVLGGPRTAERAPGEAP